MSTAYLTSIVPIKWPEKPVLPGYTVVTLRTMEEIEAVFADAIEAGKTEFSFDFETAPTEEEFDRIRKEANSIANADPENAEALIQELLKSLGQAPFDPHRAYPCTMSFCFDLYTCYLVWPDTRPGVGYLAPETVIPYCIKKAQDAGMEVIAYNMAFEAKFCAKYNLSITGKVVDPFMCIVRTLQVVKWDEIADPKSPAYKKGLKPMSKQWLGVDQQEFETVLQAHGADFFDQLPKDHPDVMRYAADDAINSLALKRYFRAVAEQIPVKTRIPGIQTYWDWLCQIEMPFTAVMGHMEYYGLAWNEEAAKRLTVTAVRELGNATRSMKELVNALIEDEEFQQWTGCDLSKYRDMVVGKTGKTKIVKQFLYDVCQIPVASTSDKTGGVSMDKEALIDTLFMLENNLTDLSQEQYLHTPVPEDRGVRNAKELKAAVTQAQPPHPFKAEMIMLIKEIQKIQAYSTLLSSHLTGREKHQNPVTGRIHSNYSVWTETARTASRNPNSQNVPRPDNDALGVRSLHRPAPGKVFVLIDYAGFELRLMALLSGDPNMIDILNHGGDLHMNTAIAMTGKAKEDVTKQERSLAKAGNFGINYGGTEHSLQSTLKTMGIRASLEECSRIVNAIKAAYPDIINFQRKMARYAYDHLHVQTLYGYKRILPLAKSTISRFRQQEERRAANTPIQGTAADIMKLAQNRILALIEQYQLHPQVCMAAQIHDEVIFEIDNDVELIDGFVEDVVNIMTRDPYPGFEVPLRVDVSVAEHSWAQKVPYEKWLEASVLADIEKGCK